MPVVSPALADGLAEVEFLGDLVVRLRTRLLVDAGRSHRTLNEETPT